MNHRLKLEKRERKQQAVRQDKHNDYRQDEILEGTGHQYLRGVEASSQDVTNTTVVWCCSVTHTKKVQTMSIQVNTLLETRTKVALNLGYTTETPIPTFCQLSQHSKRTAETLHMTQNGEDLQNPTTMKSWSDIMSTSKYLQHSADEYLQQKLSQGHLKLVDTWQLLQITEQRPLCGDHRCHLTSISNLMWQVWFRFQH